jgi:hypothetical protein
MISRGGGTVTIDTTSAKGAWATAIAHTPHLAAQAEIEFARGRTATPDPREGEAGVRPQNGTAVSPPIAECRA